MSARYFLTVCMARATIASMTVLPMCLGAQSETVRGRDITGWQKVRFGMSIGEVQRIYPAAELNQMLCGENGRDILPPGRSCKQLMLPNASAAGLTWDVTMSFSVREELTSVLLTVQDRRIADLDTFLSVLMSLNESYVARAMGVPQANPPTWAEGCQAVHERMKKGDPLRAFDFYLVKHSQRGSIVRQSGEVELNYEEREVCPGTPERVAKLFADLPAASLALSYTRRRFTTTDGL